MMCWSSSSCVKHHIQYFLMCHNLQHGNTECWYLSIHTSGTGKQEIRIRSHQTEWPVPVTPASTVPLDVKKRGRQRQYYKREPDVKQRPLAFLQTRQDSTLSSLCVLFCHCSILQQNHSINIGIRKQAYKASDSLRVVSAYLLFSVCFNLFCQTSACPWVQSFDSDTASVPNGPRKVPFLILSYKWITFSMIFYMFVS